MKAYPLVEIRAFEKLPKEQQAEYAAYRIPDSKELCIPAMNIQRALVSGATYSKGKGRSSLQKSAAACVRISPEYVGLGTDTYEIDTRSVVVPATKGRILRHRPCLKTWSVTFEIAWDSELLTENQIRQIVDDTGLRVGLLDFRPEKRGPFGTFKVTNWKKL